MSYQTLDLVLQDGIALASFNRPKRLNSLCEPVFNDLERLLDRVQDDAGIRALVLAGQGRAFCVGLDHDLLDRAFADLDYFESVLLRLNDLLFRFEDLPVPTLCAINGYARAGGFELALTADFMLMAANAHIGDNHVQYGVMPGGGSTQRLQRRIGMPRAKELIWSARWLDAAEAHALGLAYRVSAPEVLLEETVALARSFTCMPRQVLAEVKRAMHTGRDQPLRAGVNIEIATFLEYTRNHAEARLGFEAYRRARQEASAP